MVCFLAIQKKLSHYSMLGLKREADGSLGTGIVVFEPFKSRNAIDVMGSKRRRLLTRLNARVRRSQATPIQHSVAIVMRENTVVCCAPRIRLGFRKLSMNIAVDRH
jgi:hypothetical protein